MELSDRIVAGEFADAQARLSRRYWENVRRAGEPVPQSALKYLS